MKQELIDRIRAALKQAGSVAFLGGAGVSVASGIPDFRSPNGLYNKKRDDGMRYEDLLSIDYFEANPQGFYDFYWEEMVAPEAKPNAAHIALANYELSHHRIPILTQNIDGLHQLAGSREVYEFHGSTRKYTCTKCGKHYDLDDIPHQGVPLCHSCGGIIKPDVVLYGEALPEDAVEYGMRALTHADIMIVGGTSLRVYPFAALPRYFRGNLSILINHEETPLDSDFDIVIHEDIGETLTALLQ